MPDSNQAAADTRGAGDHTRGSKVSIGTHRFWEAMAVPAGAILVVHALLALALLPQPPVFLFLSVVELVVGLVTVAVDGWFLRHV
jgi:hypothetical protein